MRLTTILAALFAVESVAAISQTAQVYIQPFGTSAKPKPLGEVSYDLASLETASVISYEPPEIPEGVDHVRIGLYDTRSKSWLSGTTLASIDNFNKGYAPTLLLSVDQRGEVLSVTCKGVKIDAGQTRDFGPQALVLPQSKGKQPELNKPIVLSQEGKMVQEEPPKSFLQKYVDTCL